MAAVSARLGVERAALSGRGQSAALTETRQLVMLTGVERLGLKVKELAEQIARNAGTASRLYAEAAERRRDDAAFRAMAQGILADLTVDMALPPTGPSAIKSGD